MENESISLVFKPINELLNAALPIMNGLGFF
jgi:hypothetical protein